MSFSKRTLLLHQREKITIIYRKLNQSTDEVLIWNDHQNPFTSCLTILGSVSRNYFKSIYTTEYSYSIAVVKKRRENVTNVRTRRP